jgi:hypothetical protein
VVAPAATSRGALRGVLRVLASAELSVHAWTPGNAPSRA